MLEVENSEALALTVVEAAMELRVGRNKMLELIHSGKVKVVRAGRRIIVPRKSLSDFLNESAT